MRFKHAVAEPGGTRVPSSRNAAEKVFQEKSVLPVGDGNSTASAAAVRIAWSGSNVLPWCFGRFRGVVDRVHDHPAQQFGVGFDGRQARSKIRSHRDVIETAVEDFERPSHNLRSGRRQTISTGKRKSRELVYQRFQDPHPGRLTRSTRSPGPEVPASPCAGRDVPGIASAARLKVESASADFDFMSEAAAPPPARLPPSGRAAVRSVIRPTTTHPALALRGPRNRRLPPRVPAFAQAKPHP